jgi:phosphate transport system substrate-binding protein
MRRTRIWVVGVALTAAVCWTGCRSEGQSGGQAVNVKGSDTMVHLVSAWAEKFMAGNPQAEVAVTGGGSGTGIAALLNGTTDICMASRTIEEREQSQFAERKVQPKEYVVALDGIAVVVHPANAVGELTLEQLKKIYIGTYTNWKEVGGADEAIVLLSRESSSGTYVFFQEHVLEKKDYARSARLMPATSAIIQETAGSKGAIGYVGLGYAAEAGERIKTLKIKAKDGGPAVEPSVETVLSGKYPISRPLNFYTRGEPKGAVKAFIDFCLGPRGQEIVKQVGFVPVK